MARTRSGCVRFQASPQLPCSRPASINCVPMAPSPSRGRSRTASCSGFLVVVGIGFRMVQRVVNGFEDEAPLVIAAGGFAIAAGGSFGAMPAEHLTQGTAGEGLLAADGGHQAGGIGDVLAHGGVAGIAGRRSTALAADGIAILPGPQFDIVMERDRKSTRLNSSHLG